MVDSTDWVTFQWIFDLFKEKREREVISKDSRRAFNGNKWVSMNTIERSDVRFYMLCFEEDETTRHILCECAAIVRLLTARIPCR